MIRRPPRSTLFPYTRSSDLCREEHRHQQVERGQPQQACHAAASADTGLRNATDRKSTRLNSSHMSISYAVFCLKKKKTKTKTVDTGTMKPYTISSNMAARLS